MSAIRSTAIGVLDAKCKGFTLSAWVRPMESGRLQRILSIGANATATPLFSFLQDASNNLVLTESATPSSTTVLPAAEFTEARLVHVLVTYRAGTLYYRVSSKVELATGTAAVWPTSLDWTSADRCSIGSRHDAVATDRFNGHILSLYFTMESLGDARDSGVYVKFERASGETIGFPRLISAKGPSGRNHEILYGGNQAVSDWSAGTNRGTVAFGAAEGGVLVQRGITAQIAKVSGYATTPFGYQNSPVEADATYVYSMPAGGSLRRAPLSDLNATPTVLIAALTTYSWKIADGTTPADMTGGSAAYQSFYKTRSGYLLGITDDPDVMRFYRSADPTDWSAALAPVLSLGSSGTTGINGTEYAGRRQLGRSAYVVGKFNGADALFIGEYSNSAATTPGTIWYSVDDGATWAPFWRWQIATNRWRYVHGLAQFVSGELAAIMNSPVGDHSVIIGGTTVTWADIEDATLAVIQADVDYDVLEAGQESRWLQAITKGDWIISGNEETDLARPYSGVYACRKDATELTQVYRRANMLPPNRAQAGGGFVQQGGVILHADYVNAWTADYPSPVMEVCSSRDGFFWVPIAKFNMMESGRANICHHWTSFPYDDGGNVGMVLAGTYQQFLVAGSLARSAVVQVAAEQGLTEDLLVLNY